MKKSFKTLAMWLIIGIILVILISSIMDNKENKLTYSELIKAVQAGTVDKIELEIDNGLFGTKSNGKAYVSLKGNAKVQKQTDIPNVEIFLTAINDQITQGTVNLAQKTESVLITILNLLAPIGILIIFFLFMHLIKLLQQIFLKKN